MTVCNKRLLQKMETIKGEGLPGNGNEYGNGSEVVIVNNRIYKITRTISTY